MEFYSRSNKPPRIDTPAIYEVNEPVYKEFIDKDGKKELKKTGQTNVYEKIQTYKDECDIYKILERYERGDVNALNKVAATYADVRNAPKTLAEAQQIIIDARNDFSTLPSELKKEFDNNADVFISKIGNGTANEIFAKYNKAKFDQNQAINGENKNLEQNNNQVENNQQNQNGGVIYE